jgi:citrate lyase subunit beta/citryl-CoA lyase
MKISNINPKRSVLAVPGSSEKMIMKARTIDIDEIFLDLEDSVIPSEKLLARKRVVGVLLKGGFKTRSVAVRVNEQNTEVGIEDISSLVLKAGKSFQSLIIPKVETAQQVIELSKKLSDLEKSGNIDSDSVKIQIQIESALGLANIASIAASSERIISLIFGPGDFAASIGMKVINIGENPPNYPGSDAYHYVLMSILIAARANGLLAIDGPYSDISNTEGLRYRSNFSALLGYDGKWVIHPGQIETVNNAFTPSQQSFDLANKVIRHFNNETDSQSLSGAHLFEGKMIDEASRKMAEGIYSKGIAGGLKPSPQGEKNGSS